MVVVVLLYMNVQDGWCMFARIVQWLTSGRDILSWGFYALKHLFKSKIKKHTLLIAVRNIKSSSVAPKSPPSKVIGMKKCEIICFEITNFALQAQYVYHHSTCFCVNKRQHASFQICTAHLVTFWESLCWSHVTIVTLCQEQIYFKNKLDLGFKNKQTNW